MQEQAHSPQKLEEINFLLVIQFFKILRNWIYGGLLLGIALSMLYFSLSAKVYETRIDAYAEYILIDDDIQEKRIVEQVNQNLQNYKVAEKILKKIQTDLYSKQLNNQTFTDILKNHAFREKPFVHIKSARGKNNYEFIFDFPFSPISPKDYTSLISIIEQALNETGQKLLTIQEKEAKDVTDRFSKLFMSSIAIQKKLYDQQTDDLSKKSKSAISEKKSPADSNFYTSEGFYTFIDGFLETNKNKFYETMQESLKSMNTIKILTRSYHVADYKVSQDSFETSRKIPFGAASIILFFSLFVTLVSGAIVEKPIRQILK